MSIVSRKMKSSQKYIVEYKDSLILCGIFLAGLIVIAIICGVIKGQFNNKYVTARTAVEQLDNEIYNYKSSVMQNKLGDGYVGKLSNAGNTNIKLVGDEIDAGKWQQDNDAFWNFISPMFNFNSAEEYNNMCQNYRKQLGSCLLTNVFLAPVDIDGQDDPQKFNESIKCKINKKEGFEAYPIGMDAENGYEYIALITFGSSNAFQAHGYSSAIFTYRVTWDEKDANGNTIPTITDLQYAMTVSQ